MKKTGSNRNKILSAVLSAALLTNTIPLAAIAADAPVYKDGTYTGAAKGRNGDVSVSVTVTNGMIAAIDVTDQQETPAFWNSAQEIIPQIIKANQTAGVDAVSGATLSSEAIKAAVDQALAGSVDSGFFESGTGSEADPYIIKTVSQLTAFAESVDSGKNYAGQYIALDADLYLTDAGIWNPIGAEGAASVNLDKIFAGTFDGRNHKISGLTIKTEEDAPYAEEQNIGLFSTLLSTAKVTGIQLENVNIQVAGSKVVRAGGITGDVTSNAVSKTEGHAIVDRCSVSGSISTQTDAAMVMTGGIVGRAAGNATISNCVSDTAIRSSSNTKIAYGAGIVSMSGNDTYILNCVNSGDVTVLTQSGFSLYAGGVSGMMTSEQYNCFSSGNITVGTITKNDAVSGAGVLNGALMPAASGSYDYYASDAAIFYMDENGASTTVEAVSHGAGSMNAEGTFTPSAMTEAQISGGELIDTLNQNLSEVSKALKTDTELLLWKLSDNGKPVLSNEVYVNDVVDASIFEGGNGTKESPYQLRTADQLRAFAASLSEHIDYTGTYIELTNNIDISGTEWTPIGESRFPFNGSFDGKGYTISSMTIGSAEEAKALQEDEIYLGLFSILGTNAVVKNISLTDVLINVSYDASAYAGGIAAAMDSDDSGFKGAVVDSCSVDGSITVTAETGNNFVGGIAAYVYKGAIINCKTNIDASCTVKTGGSYGETGGIAALVNRGLVANCCSLGNVYGSGNREDEGMAVVSSLVAVNAGYLVNCYGSGQHKTNDYSVYTGAVSGWITGIGHAYDCYYNSEASMTIGETAVDPVADVGTRVSSGVSDDGMIYTGGVVYQNAPYSTKDYSSLAEKLNANFNAFPAELTQFGLTNDALKQWQFNGSEVTFSDAYATVSYVQPEAEIVTKQEMALHDGTWYGRGSKKQVVVTIEVANGEIKQVTASDGSTAGEAYEEALQIAKDKSTYQDKTTYAAADVSVFDGGKGTQDEPYLVSTETQLRYIAEAMNDDVDWENIWFALNSDIALTGGDWLPIGHAIQAEINGQKETVSVYPFRGSFDGKGHTISGLSIGSAESPADAYLAGLFGLAAGAHDTNLTPEDGERLVHIQNVKLKDIAFYIHSRYEANAGGLVAWAQNGFVLDNCSAEGTMNVTTKESFGRVGGLVGSTLRGVITDCFTNVSIHAATETSSVYAGGLAGMTNRSAQVNCYALGDVCADAESNNKATVGGLTGMSGGTNINCYTYGNVESLVTTVDVGGVNGRCAGIALDYECYFNEDASQKTAGKEIAEKKVSGTTVGDAIRSTSKKASEMASADFADTLNANKANMSGILKEVSNYLEDMTENNKEGLSHLLFYTNDGTDLNAWSADEKAPRFAEQVEPSVPETTETTENTAANITSDDELCIWAKNDYQKKTGKAPADAALQGNADGTYAIALKDSSGKDLDTYVIDPKTGKGVNAANESVDLPQTGNNAPDSLLLMIAAMLLTGLGWLTAKRANRSAKKNKAN